MLVDRISWSAAQHVCSYIVLVLGLYSIYFFFFNDTATTEIYTLSLHDALPILGAIDAFQGARRDGVPVFHPLCFIDDDQFGRPRSEEHTSELQSRGHLVCRLLLEKKKNIIKNYHILQRIDTRISALLLISYYTF